MEDPATTGPAHGDPLVAAAVPDQRHQDHVVAQGSHRAEPEPVVPTLAVLHPGRSVRPLGGEVAAALRETRVLRGVQLGPLHVHVGVREVGQPARVVLIEVGQHDVGDVADIVPQRADLSGGGLRPREHRADERQPGRTEPPGVGDVVGAESGVHQQQPVAALDQQAVRDHARHQPRPEARAVEVMDHAPDRVRFRSRAGP
jgi:hypothetical protein